MDSVKSVKGTSIKEVGSMNRNKNRVVTGLVELIKGEYSKSRVRNIMQMFLDIQNNTDEVGKQLKYALDVVLFNDDYAKASKIVKGVSDYLLDGCGDLYYNPNILVTVMLPEDLKDIITDFLMEPDTNFSLIANKIAKELGRKKFRNLLFEGLLGWDPFYSFVYIETIKHYLNEEELARLTIDRYDDETAWEIEDYFDPEAEERHTIIEIAKRTGREEFSF